MAQKPRELSRRLQILLTITIYLTLDRRRKAFRAAINAIEARTITRRSVSELFLHLSLFLGYPVTLEGLEAIASQKNQQRGSTSLRGSSQMATVRGKRTFHAIYGSQSRKVIRSLNRLHSGLGDHVVTEAYGRIMTRRGLDLAERELVNVTVLHIKGFRRQLFSHIRGAMRAGVNKQTLETLASFVEQHAQRSPSAFLAVLEAISQERA